MFKIIHDLSSLPESDRAQYCRDYAAYLGLNPDENRIDTIWMNSDSVRALVAYVRRGTAEILRDVHGIDTTELVKEDGPGYVSYKATGVNRRGRKEIAVGAFATTGLTGDRLAAAIATAQTRALRRLTLQFVGGGLLDESEVSHDPVQASSPLAVPAVQPQVKPNDEIGKPVVPESGERIQTTVFLPPPPGAVERRKDRRGSPWTSQVFSAGDEIAEEIKLKKAMAGAPTEMGRAAVKQVNAILAKDAPPTESKEKKKRGRKPKNTVDMGDVDQLIVNAANKTHEAHTGTTVPNLGTTVPNLGTTVPNLGTIEPPTGQKLTYVPTCPDCNAFMAADERLDMYLCVQHGRVDTNMKPSIVRNSAPPIPATPAPVPVPVAPPPVAQSLLTPDQQKSIKTRLSTFWVYILPEQGGMTSDDGLSINGKLMKFANTFHASAPNHKDWSFEQWDNFIKWIETYNTENGPKALVEYINKTIGAA